MIRRDIYDYLRNFFQNEKKSLLVTGARQVGKTYAIRKIGKECFPKMVELNFVEEPDLVSVFENPRNAKEILLRISAATGVKLVPGKTLIFFDEVQKCPEIVTAIKFLVDEGSYRYVMSGSLLGVELKNIRSVPVGYMAEREMFPLDLKEFAEAVGMSSDVMSHLRECYDSRKPVDDVVHRKMLELVQLYLVIGGMPEAVQKYINTNNIQVVQEAQRQILNTYHRDITQYDPEIKLYIKDAFDLIPSELSAKNKRFILKSLNEHAKFNRMTESFLWLKDAEVALPTYNVEEPKMPLKLAGQRNLFKLFQSDVGLLACQYSGNFALQMLSGETTINYGAIYENLAAQELKAHGYELYYFNSKRQGEVDFVIEHEGKVLPIEIKSGKDYKRHNALCNILANEEYGVAEAMVFTNGNTETSGKVVYLPIYLIMYLRPKELGETMYRFQAI